MDVNKKIYKKIYLQELLKQNQQRLRYTQHRLETFTVARKWGYRVKSWDELEKQLKVTQERLQERLKAVEQGL